MRWFLLVVAASGCGVEGEVPVESDGAALHRAGPFVDTVIRSLGTDGELCYPNPSGVGTTCVSNTRIRPEPLALGDDPASQLYLCAQQPSGDSSSCTSSCAFCH